MDKSQLNVMRVFGYAIEELPSRTIPKTTYYKVENGSVVTLHGLPADPYHMQRYLKRGFTLEVPKLEPPLTEPQIESPVGFSCEACDKVLSTRLALAGHSRSHKVK